MFTVYILLCHIDVIIDVIVPAMNLFRISPATGVISVSNSLLGKGGKQYKITVRAEDNGDSPLFGYALVDIMVLSTEIDDGNPKWRSPAVGAILYANEVTRFISVN